jgi:hypothetical protein
MTASIFSPLLSPSWIWIWEWLEFISIVVVGIGCWGEVWAEHHKFKTQPNDLMPPSLINKKYERVFWLMVVFGLGIELIAFGFSFLAANREIEGLHRANLELQRKLQPRRITMEQRTNFIASTVYIPKIPIKILIGQEGKDTEDLAGDLRETLTMAGFKINSDAGAWGINRDSTLITTAKLNNTNDSDLLIFSNMTNDGPHIITTLAERFRGLVTPVNVGSNQADVYGALIHCFNQIGLKSEWSRAPQQVPPNECIIYIQVK